MTEIKCKRIVKSDFGGRAGKILVVSNDLKQFIGKDVEITIKEIK